MRGSRRIPARAAGLLTSRPGGSSDPSALGLARHLVGQQQVVVGQHFEVQGRLLRVLLEDEEALRPVIEALGGEVGEYYAGVREGMFAENIDLLIYSTPVKCLAVRGRVVEMSEEADESDNLR
jgi:hypothetical protein